jgi:hypothetical protein
MSEYAGRIGTTSFEFLSLLNKSIADTILVIMKISSRRFVRKINRENCETG